MATLAEKLLALPTVDLLSGRTENPVNKPGEWEKEAGSANIGQVTETGWRTTTANTSAGMLWVKDALTNPCAVKFRLPVIPPAASYGYDLVLFGGGAVDVLSYIVRVGFGTGWYAGLIVGGSEVASGEIAALANNDDYALSWDEGEANGCKLSRIRAGEVTTLLQATATKGLSLGTRSGLLYFPGGADVTSRASHFATGTLVEAATPRPGSRNLLGVGR